ncbi:MAG: AAA family ATPase, partial [Bacteroidales bacterium]|nr:AAA family ATPase [Bacteroidales bacterium]
LDYLHKPEQLTEVRRIMQEFYQVVKICDADEQFVFITGITKFSQLSIFSTLNNLRNISMMPQYSALCGITKNELVTVFDQDIQLLADEYGCSKEVMLDMLKLQYDGYHFGKKSDDVFNPFSLMYAFTNKDVGYYWFGSGTPTFLFEAMKRFHTNLLELEQLQVPSSQFDVPTEAMTSALPLLYQAGYLTIKGYDFNTTRYTLDFPNAEVKVGFMENFMARMMNLGNTDSRGFAGDFYACLIHHDIEGALKAMQAFFASIPYLDFGEKELDDIAKYEAYYEVLTYVVFSIFNYRTFTQVKVARGRTDVVVFMRDAVYVMELKMHGTAQEALAQINSKDYAIPYQAEGKPVVKIGIAFSQETKTVSDWIIEKD